jgi:hypothetical protein
MIRFIKELIISVPIAIGLIVGVAKYGRQIDAIIGLPNASNYIAISAIIGPILASFLSVGWTSERKKVRREKNNLQSIVIN